MKVDRRVAAMVVRSSKGANQFPRHTVPRLPQGLAGENGSVEPRRKTSADEGPWARVTPRMKIPAKPNAESGMNPNTIGA